MADQQEQTTSALDADQEARAEALVRARGVLTGRPGLFGAVQGSTQPASATDLEAMAEYIVTGTRQLAHIDAVERVGQLLAPSTGNGLGVPLPGDVEALAEYVVWGSSGPMPVRMGIDPTLPGFFHGRTPRDRAHIAEKPVDVMRGLVRIAPPGGTVLDLFMGVGTTGVAAVAEGRRFIGAELVAAHYATAERRIRASLGEPVATADQAALDLRGDSR